MRLSRWSVEPVLIGSKPISLTIERIMMLLLLDVDGVLNPKASRNWLDKSDFRRRNTTIANGNTYPVWLNRAHGQILLNFARCYDMELVWCTTWEHEANEFIGWRIGLPKLPVIEFGFNAARWKFNAVLEYAAGRPLAWLDDDFALHHDHRDWFLQQRTEPTHLQQVTSETGFTTEDLVDIAMWIDDTKVARASEIEAKRWPNTLKRLAE